MRIPVGFEILRQTLALRHYRLYVLGNITSNLGMWTQRVAMGWLTWELTHSTTWLGINADCRSRAKHHHRHFRRRGHRPRRPVQAPAADAELFADLFGGARDPDAHQCHRHLDADRRRAAARRRHRLLPADAHDRDLWPRRPRVPALGAGAQFDGLQHVAIFGPCDRRHDHRHRRHRLELRLRLLPLHLHDRRAARDPARRLHPAAGADSYPPLDHSRDHRRLPLHHSSRRHPHAALPADRDVGRRQADHGSAAGLRRPRSSIAARPASPGCFPSTAPAR